MTGVAGGATSLAAGADGSVFGGAFTGGRLASGAGEAGAGTALSIFATVLDGSTGRGDVLAIVDLLAAGATDGCGAGSAWGAATTDGLAATGAGAVRSLAGTSALLGASTAALWTIDDLLGAELATRTGGGPISSLMLP